MINKADNLKRKQQMNDFDGNSDPIGDVTKKMKINDIKQYLMPVHIVTCGLQGADLGRDETAIIQICVSLIDMAKMEITGERNIILQASSLLDQDADPEKIHISIPAREMTGLISIPNSDSYFNLRQALTDIDRFIRSITVVEDLSEIDVVPVTIGHLPLRSVLHREARFRNIQLPHYWYNYFDLCHQMSFCYKSNFATMKDICLALQIVNYENSVSIIYNMSHATLYLLKYGHIFNSRNYVKTTYTPTVFHVNDPIDEDVVIVIKPVDYKTPISQVLPFFNGVNIADGGVAVIMSDGRRSNKILVRLVDKMQRDIALLRDKHHLESGNTRYITMSTFDSQEFMKIAGCEDDNVQNYLVQLTNQEEVLIRMKGLPFTVTKDEILQFFNTNDTEVKFGLEGIFLVQRPSGDLNGDAFIIFHDEGQASKATNLKGSMIGNRYVEIFHSTPAEMNQVIAGIKSGVNQSKLSRKSSKGREFENIELLKNSNQIPLTLLNSGMLQNMLTNKIDAFVSAIITSLIPIEATDGDFLNFLGEYQGCCTGISKLSSNSPIGYTSYIAKFKDTYNAQLVLKSLSNKFFKVDILNKEFPVKMTIIPLNVPSIVKSYVSPNPLLQKSPLSSLNIIPSIFSIPSSLMQSSFNLNPIQVTNGSLVNFNAIPNLHILNQYNQMSLLSNALRTNFLNCQLQPQITFQSPITQTYISPVDRNLSSTNNNLLLPKVPVAPTVSQVMLYDTSSVVMLYGVQIQLLQQDLDELFKTLLTFISAIPKLLQMNQVFYAQFNSTEDAKIAMSRCPIILYKNQTIYLIPIN